MEVSINLSFNSKREAEAVAVAVSPDNVRVPEGLFVETVVCGVRVLTTIRCRTRFETFVSTVDDFLCAVCVAERSVAAVKGR